MLAKLLPIIFLLLGAGGGVGAGLFLAPDPGSSMEDSAHEAGEPDNTKEGSQAAANDPHDSKTDAHGDETNSSASEFVEMSNQFVIPVIKNDAIAAMVVVSLSLETRRGFSEEIYAREPKLRDVFLRVLFDHANMGGFHGAFTDAETMELLRTALRQVAQMEVGPDLLDVLIVDIIRRDT